MPKHVQVPLYTNPREVHDWRIRASKVISDALSYYDVYGTINQVIVTINPDFTITLSLPQNIDTSADVEFDSIKLDDLTASRLVSSDANKKLISVANLASWIAGTDNQVTVTNDGDGSITLSFANPTYLGSAANIAAGNYAEFEADGTLKLNGTATVFEDLNFDPARAGTPAASVPDFVAIGDVVHVEFTSANNQYCGAGEEVPHEYKLSTTLYPHIHLFLKGGESAGTTGVTFTFYWELRQTSGLTTGSVTLSATSAQLTANPVKFDVYDNTGFSGPTDKGGHLKVKLARTAGNAGDVIVLTYGVHYEIDTLGSRTILTK